MVAWGPIERLCSSFGYVIGTIESKAAVWTSLQCLRFTNSPIGGPVLSILDLQNGVRYS